MSRRVIVSIGDFSPLFRGLKTVFRALADAEIDGVELALGVKSRWRTKRLLTLAAQHEVSIVSVHQPLWSALGLWFDEGAFSQAKKMKVSQIVCHPLPRVSLDSPTMTRYFKKLALMQTIYGVTVSVENLPPAYRNRLMSFATPHPSTQNPVALAKKLKEYGLSLTVDTDHFRMARPHETSHFSDVLPLLSNIHLSSFSDRKHHLPLTKGNLDIEGLIQFLEHHSYTGQLTLEIAWPRSINLWRYEIDAVSASLQCVKLSGKS